MAEQLCNLQGQHDAWLVGDPSPARELPQHEGALLVVGISLLSLHLVERISMNLGGDCTWRA